MNQTRILPLEGVHNFRDYGGYRAAGGGMVRSGLLWRSGEHGGASAGDLAAIGALDLQTVIDLRGNTERADNPCLRAPGFNGEVVFHDGETAGLALHVEAADGVLTVADAQRAMQALYAQMAWRPGLIPVFRAYFSALETREGTSVVHCLAGKDRTGFIVSMLHHVLGVHADDAMADYLLTNHAGNIERRIAAGAHAIRLRRGNIDDATIRALMGVEAEYLSTAHEAVIARHGSIDAYLAEVLGLDAARAEALRAKLIVA